jgi:Fic family protein
MTYREFFNAVINNEITDEVIAMAKAEIVKLDNRNEKRRNTLTPEQKENEALKAKMLEGLNGTVIASEVASKYGISTQKASALLRQIVEDGKATVGAVKVKGKGTVKAYTIG